MIPVRRMLLIVVALSVSAAGLAAAPLRIFLRASQATYGPGIHDHPRWLAEWTKLLRERGAVVNGGLTFPSAAQLDATDVVVLYAVEAASIAGDERARLEAFLARGGGIVALHNAVAGDYPEWWKTIVGGAWEHRYSKEHLGTIGLYVRDREHPITRGTQNFDLDDELYYRIHLAPEAHVLVNGFHSVFEITPQMWVYEKDRYRAFVALQGHRAETFNHHAWRGLVLRGIAWAGRREVDTFNRPDEVKRLRYPEGGPRRPETASSTMVLHPDFDLSLVAAEPLVVNPISIDWDARGRMWVALTPGYPNKESASGISAHDRIVILEDKDGDGRMENARTFADQLDLVTSLVHYQDGVIVSASPEILWLRDTDGDDVADRRVVLYRGFGFADTHAVISNLIWGSDGWIYAAQGYSGQDSVHVVGQRDFGAIPGGLFRFRPDGSAIELILSANSNVWGLDRAPDGELFFSLANGSHLRHVVMPDRALAAFRVNQVEGFLDVTDHSDVSPIRTEDREPYRQIDFVGGFTAAAGNVIYDGGAWPDEYQLNHFVCEPTVNLVHRDLLRPDGMSYVASRARRSEFLASTDLWFRPVHLRVGPDGALYVLDFYNQAIVHDDARGPERGSGNATIRPDRDHLHGRIWRIQHKRANPSRRTLIDPASDGDLIKALEEPGSVWRQVAARVIAERDVALVAALIRTAKNSSSAATRGDALWLVERARAMTQEVLEKALADADPSVRKAAYQIAGAHGREFVGSVVTRLATETHPRVRLIAIIANGRAVAAHRPELLVTMARTGADDWNRSALIDAFAERPRELVVAALGESDADRFGPLAAGAAELIGRARDRDAIVALFEAAVGAKRSQVATAAMTHLLEAWPLDELPAGFPQIETALGALLASPDADLRGAALPFAARVAAAPTLREIVATAIARERAVLADRKRTAIARVSALRSLLAVPGERGAALRDAIALLAPPTPPDVQLAIVKSLDGYSDAPVAEALTAAFPTLAPQARETAFVMLSQRAPWMLRFLAAVGSGRIPAAAVGAERRSRLAEHPDPAVRGRATEVFAVGPRREPGEMDARIAELAQEVERPGDALNGRRVFEQNCATCHIVRGVGTRFGPDLSGMGSEGAASLLGAILDPNQAVDPSYQVYNARTADGRTLSGILASDTPDRIVLRDASGDTALRRSEMESLTGTGRSPMPSGFEVLGAEALRDILSYMGSGYEDFRIVSLRDQLNASTWHGLYDAKRHATHMEFERYGTVDAFGIPFEVIDPLRSDSGFNALVLRGGAEAEWDSKLRMPLEASIEVGFAVRRVFVLGGIAGWGFPFSDDRGPAVEWTFEYEDGTREVHTLRDGVEFADWISRHDVSGSRHVASLLRPSSPGQVRLFSVTPSRRDVIVARIGLKSFDNQVAPTFLALTAQPASAALDAADAQRIQALAPGLIDREPEVRARAITEGVALLSGANTPERAIAVIDELAALEPVAVATILTVAFPALAPAPRERAFQSLLIDFQRGGRLLDALATGRIPLSDLDSGQEARLRGHAEPELRNRAAAVLAARSSRSAETELKLAKLLPTVMTGGDIGRGRSLFKRECASCHAFVEESRSPRAVFAEWWRAVVGSPLRLGPDLTGIGAKGRERVLTALIDSDRALVPGFEEHEARLVDGSTGRGIVIADDDEHLTLRSANGERTWARAEVSNLRATGGSTMPLSFESDSPHDYRDLIAYLSEGYEGYRVVDLSSAFTASTAAGMFDVEHASGVLSFVRAGVIKIEGVPFDLVDPRRTLSRYNAVVLKGGADPTWDSSRVRPVQVEIPVGFTARRLHILGGVAAWGYPFTPGGDPIAGLTLHYQDGAREDLIFEDGKQFADWIRRVEVPGSAFVEGVVAPGTDGQVRSFSVAPGRPDAVVDSITLESFGTHAAPVFLALTAEVSDVPASRWWGWLLIPGLGGMFLWWMRRWRARRLIP